MTIAQAQFVMGLQTIVSRSVPPAETAVISVGSIHGGSCEAPNVMPAEIEITGTMRCFSKKVQDLIATRIEVLAQSAAAATGCSAQVALDWRMTVLVNHDAQTDVAIAAASDLVGVGNVKSNIRPITGGEDFAFMLEQCPGAFILIGNGVGHAIHTPLYDFNDAIIPLGVAYWVSLVRRELSLAA